MMDRVDSKDVQTCPAIENEVEPKNLVISHESLTMCGEIAW